MTAKQSRREFVKGVAGIAGLAGAVGLAGVIPRAGAAIDSPRPVRAILRGGPYDGRVVAPLGSSGGLGIRVEEGPGGSEQTTWARSPALADFGRFHMPGLQVYRPTGEVDESGRQVLRHLGESGWISWATCR